MRLFLISALILLVACESDTATNGQQNVVREPSAAANVLILEKKLSIPELNRERQLRIYLPPDYAKSDNRYPVIYMHDGQNLFDDVTSYAGEWRVDETLNELYQVHGLGLIVIGIDNSPVRRSNEYSPWTNPDYGSAEGEEYVDFIVNIVKPYIDQNYRTISSPDATAIMGSSMGGLISFYAILKYPEIFTKAGVYSPSFWFAEPAYTYAEERLGMLTKDHQIHMLVGGKEGEDMVSGTRRMEQLILSQRHKGITLTTEIDPDGEHHEVFWGKHFKTTIELFFPPER